MLQCLSNNTAQLNSTQLNKAVVVGASGSLRLEELQVVTPPTQEMLSAPLDEEDLNSYLTWRTDMRDAARMRALAERHTATFLQATPDPDQNLLLPNQEFTAYCCLRLGRVPHEKAPCPLCKSGFLDEQGYHQVSDCRKGSHRHRRHNELADELARHAVRGGFTVLKDVSLTATCVLATSVSAVSLTAKTPPLT